MWGPAQNDQEFTPRTSWPGRTVRWTRSSYETPRGRRGRVCAEWTSHAVYPLYATTALTLPDITWNSLPPDPWRPTDTAVIVVTAYPSTYSSLVRTDMYSDFVSRENAYVRCRGRSCCTVDTRKVTRPWESFPVATRSPGSRQETPVRDHLIDNWTSARSGNPSRTFPVPRPLFTRTHLQSRHDRIGNCKD